MDFLNKSSAQLSELFRSMTPGARILAGLLLAVVVVSVGYLFRQGTAGQDAYLFGGEPLPDGQLTRAEAAIAQAGLTNYSREGNRIRVPAGQQAEYLAAVADAGALPPNFNTILENALDRGGPWESAAATRQRLKIATQQTLGEIVRAMYWVDDAVVLYDEQERRQAGRLTPSKHLTASVSVRPISGEALDARRVKMLQKLVAHAVTMSAEDVAVINLGDGSMHGSESSLALDMFDDEYNQTRIAFEMQKKDSILNALRDIPGVRVEVNVELDDTIEESRRSVLPDQKTAMLRETTRSEESKQSTGAGGGRPGVTVQGPNRPTTAEVAQRQNQSETSTSQSETENMVGVEEHRIVQRGYTPKEIWATVTVPGSYIESLWKVKNPEAEGKPKPEELRLLQDDVVVRVENIVEPLLLLQSIKGENTYKHVRVVVLDSLPAPTIEPPSTAGKAVAWAGRYWSTLAMLGVAIFSLMVLRNVVRAGSAPSPTPAAASANLSLHIQEPSETGGEKEDGGEERPRLRLKKSSSLKDDLVEIVREDPDAAADILRSWIGKAG